MLAVGRSPGSLSFFLFFFCFSPPVSVQWTMPESIQSQQAPHRTAGEICSSLWSMFLVTLPWPRVNLTSVGKLNSKQRDFHFSLSLRLRADIVRRPVRCVVYTVYHHHRIDWLTISIYTVYICVCVCKHRVLGSISQRKHIPNVPCISLWVATTY